MPTELTSKSITLYYTNNKNSYKHFLYQKNYSNSVLGDSFIFLNKDYNSKKTFYLYYNVGSDTKIINSKPIFLYNFSDTTTLINNSSEVSITSKSIVICSNDLNNDNKEDLIITGTYEFSDLTSLINESASGEQWEYKLQDENGLFNTGNVINIAGNVVTGGVSSEDFNKDGLNDVIMSVTEINETFPFISSDAYIYLYKQTTNLNFDL